MAKKVIAKKPVSKSDTTVVTPRYKIDKGELSTHPMRPTRLADTTHKKILANGLNERLTAKRNIERQKEGKPFLKSGKTIKGSFVEPKGLTHAQRPLKKVAVKKK